MEQPLGPSGRQSLPSLCVVRAKRGGGVVSEASNRPRVDPRLRESALEALTEAFAGDVIEVEEFERRAELVHRAESPAELRTLLEDLPSAETRPVPLNDAGRPSRTGRGGLPSPSRGRLPDGVQDETNLVFSVLSGATRTGRWIPARRNTAVAFMGGIELDFREAHLPPGETQVNCFSVMGGIDIIVPPDVVVVSTGFGFMGGFDHRAQNAELPEDAPILRITGFAFMGGVDVSVRYPGETARDAKRRRRLERKEQRRLSRGG